MPLYRLLLAVTGALCALPAFSGPVAEALDDGEAKLDLRYRYEFVDQEPFASDANASTLRGRFNWLSGEVDGFRGFLEIDAVGVILADDYNSGSGTSGAARNRYPVVADPDYAEINQVYLQYSGWKGSELRLGRQRILLDNQRFVGGVGWRQNEQTYDAVSIGHQLDAGTKAFYAYVANVNRIFGDDVPAGDHESSTHLLNASRVLGDAGTLTGYYYAIDNDDSPGASTNTLGLRFAGQAMLGSRPLNYIAEYARQTDAANNPVDFDADYLRLEGSLALDGVNLTLGYELLSGDSGRSGAAFRTPLATLHAHNGWADQFLATPDSGLTDIWAGVSGKLDAWSWQALYHLFESDAASTDFGNELDLSIGRKLGEHYSVLLKAALFDADAMAFGDTTKLWFMLSAAW